ncbi:amidohydrolase family protein [Gelidibacter sp. F63206]|nr:amidohydrolase family protein [Gelidibacter sp. F63206]
MLGDIYQVPIEGGKAKVILQDEHLKRGAKLSPDGKTLAYISDESGEFQVWTYDLKSHAKFMYPVIESIHYPLHGYWKNNKEIYIPSEDGLFSFYLQSGKSTPIRKAKEDEKSILQIINRTLSVNNKSSLAGFQKEGAFWVYDLQKKQDVFVDKIPGNKVVSHFKISPSGKSLLFYIKNEQNFYKQQLRKWDFDTHENKLLFEGDETSFFSTSIYDYDFINDNFIVLDHQGKIVKMNTNTQEYEPIPIQVDIRKKIKKPLQSTPRYISDSLITAKVLRNPIMRKDIDTIYLGAFGKLRGYSKKTGEIREYYADIERFEVSPSLSPNGKYLAYTTWNDWEMGHLYIREILTGKETQITITPGRYINPAWSPNSSEIVFIADETENKMGTGRLSPASNTVNYHLDIHQIKVFDQEKPSLQYRSNIIKRIYPISQLTKRFYPIPVYHPDGENIFIAKKSKNISSYSRINLNTKEIEQEIPIPFHSDEILISPDAKKIAFIFDEKIWLDVFPFSTDLNFADQSEFITKEAHYNGGYVYDVLLPKAKSIFEIAPSYIYWQDEYTLMWASAEEIYQHDIRAGATAKITEIKVQKPRDIPKTQYALTNARIITMNQKDEIVENGTILIQNNRIQSIGSNNISIPENYKIFDLEGKTIMPGLIDVHAHYHHSPHEFINQQENNYIGNLAFGVTAIYDPSVNILDYKERAQMIEVGDLAGPRIFASGNIILEKPGPHEYDYKNITNKNDAIRIVKSYKKIDVPGPIKEYSIRNTHKRIWLREAAKNEDIGITAHQKFLNLALSRIILGYTAIEHEIGNSLFQNDVKILIGQSGVHYTPTFIVSPQIGNLFQECTKVEEPKLINLNGNILFQNKFSSFAKGSNSKNHRNDLTNEKIRREIERASAMIKDLRSLGSNISVGGHGNPLPGIGTHMEIWSFTYKNGLSNYEALKAATLIGAQKISLQEEIGSLEKGKLADIIVLTDNPLEDIFNSTHILYTIQNGNIYESDSMKKIFPTTEELKPWGRESPIVLNHLNKNKGGQ